MQKFIGFDSAETRWLYVDGFARTHILQTTIRYFSFFTDAANFGAAMGYSMFFFSIIAFVRNSLPERLYYLFVALMAGYGMMISGTRTAMVVPFVALFVYILLRKDFKKIIYMSLLLAGALIFFKYTTILNGNPEIRRMRSAFHPENDPSYLVRLANQQKMKVYMADRYFGVGIGLGGGKAKRYAPDAYMSQIATDSWFVMIWVETGIVGLLLHILTLLMILAGGAYILLFKIRDDDLRTYLIAFYAGLTGMIAASYANEIFGQLPNGFTIFTGMAFVYLGPFYDRELSEAKNNTLNHEHE
ncbi:MAG: O-antigen ligase family protein, partial [Bacteroidales bacterium]